jgi:hypothetical protein
VSKLRATRDLHANHAIPGKAVTGVTCSREASRCVRQPSGALSAFLVYDVLAETAPNPQEIRVTSKTVSPLTAIQLVASLFLVAAMGCGGSSSGKDAAGAQTEDAPEGQGGSGGVVLGNGGFVGSSGGAVVGGGGTVASGGIVQGSGGGAGGQAGAGSGGVGSGGITGTGGAIVTCGEPGFTCCAGNACNGGGCCVAGICMAQGGTCVGLGGGVCSAGACGTCGGPGLPCCGADPGTGSCTSANTKCNSGTCSKCGELGLACCAGPTGGSAGVCNSAETICSNNLCVPCGTPGTACCQGSLCAGTGCCYNNLCLGENTACGATAGTCQAGRCSGCGNAAQPCCTSASASTCYDGLLCKGGTCTSCGNSGEACCLATSTVGQCKAGTACTSGGSDGVCARCGTLGDICCAGSTCSDGCCSGGRCLSSSGGCATGSPDGGGAADAPVSQCATGGAPCSALARFTGTQILDGKDDEFCTIPSFELTFANAVKVNEYNTVGGRTYPERVVARVAWDEAGIHAFIRVDDTIFTPAASTALWNGDGVELMFSSSTAVTGLTSVDTNTLHIIASPPNVQSSKDTASTGNQTALPSTQFFAGSDTTGYWVELNLPWPGTAPTANAQIKFDMQLNSADGPMKSSDSQVRDAQAILYQASATTTSCASTIYPFCDDRVWCTTTLQP